MAPRMIMQDQPTSSQSQDQAPETTTEAEQNFQQQMMDIAFSMFVHRFVHRNEQGRGPSQEGAELGVGVGAGAEPGAGDGPSIPAPITHVNEDDKIVFFLNGAFVQGQNVFLTPEQFVNIEIPDGTQCRFIQGIYLGRSGLR